MNGAPSRAVDEREVIARCSLRALHRGDPMLGTAFPASRLLLVEQPGPWGRAGLRESRFDRGTAVQVEARAAAVGARVLAIRRYGRTAVGALRRWAFADCRPGHETLRWGRFRHDAELLDIVTNGIVTNGIVTNDVVTNGIVTNDIVTNGIVTNGIVTNGPHGARGGGANDPHGTRGADANDPDGVADAEPCYLVCAHGRHDVCCAVAGRPVAAALAALRPDRVWECSHVGGDRFAANVLVLPAGLLYGQVSPAAVAELVETSERGEVLGALLRGRIGLRPVAQAALAFAFEHLDVRNAAALTVVGVRGSGSGDGAAIVRIRAPQGLLDVTVRVEPMRGDGLTCAHPGPGTYQAYRPQSVTPVE